MRLGLKVFLAALLAAALVVPGATAKPGGQGGGNGGGQGKPAWAGGGSGGGGQGKPAWAGGAKGAAKKAEKAAAKAAAKAAKAEGAEAAGAEGAKGGKPDLANLDELTEEDLEGLNPAWTCKVERALFGESEGFVGKYATNENGANAFGMCVSEEAQERDGVSEVAVAQFCEPEAQDEASSEAEGTEGAAVVVSEGEDPVEGEAAEDGICPGDTSEEAATDASEAGDDSEGDEGSGDEEEAEGEDASEQELVVALLRSLF